MAAKEVEKSEEMNPVTAGRDEAEAVEAEQQEKKANADELSKIVSDDGKTAEGSGKEGPIQQQPPSTSGDATASAAHTLPNLYNKFVSSFENALHDLISETEEPKLKQKLRTLDLDGVARYIREEQPSIIFMVGAGISTSAGIPDFRTPGTGLYDNLAKFNLPNPQAVFDIGFFKRNPEPFFVLAKELFHENIKPTPAHYFMRLVDEKGLLRRCFTQNIDSLEYTAGLGEEKVVPAHGSHRTSTCLSCKKKYNLKWIMAQIKNKDFKVPRCEGCKKGIVKPDIVFFGESLPPRFFSSTLVDFPKCDLLIIMGTSLIVHPFAALVNNVPIETPRLLMNLAPVGRDSLSYDERGNVRDVFWKGECDRGVFELARLLGWEQELREMVDSEGNPQPLN